jgi:hypothetical protein
MAHRKVGCLAMANHLSRACLREVVARNSNGFIVAHGDALQLAIYRSTSWRSAPAAERPRPSSMTSISHDFDLGKAQGRQSPRIEYRRTKSLATIPLANAAAISRVRSIEKPTGRVDDPQATARSLRFFQGIPGRRCPNAEPDASVRISPRSPNAPRPDGFYGLERQTRTPVQRIFVEAACSRLTHRFLLLQCMAALACEYRSRP